MKKIVALSLLWSACVVVLLGLLLFSRPQAAYPPPDGAPYPGPTPFAYSRVFIACSVVTIVFAIDISALWLLSKIGGRLKADVKATINKFGGNLVIASAGLVGCFLAIAVLAFAGIYLITDLINR